ncbi:predicted protein [Nematostella vectensis]|uniref:EF-hand domain-containing protein n=1 Tax=Nematostella vectensis TaxID=45351 RepID=A7S185_NEMVE|nr:predicted protein [Nematostella vectensis]|eukprot:XP_001634617.1 predicted protein [Nematostella vectensis]
MSEIRKPLVARRKGSNSSLTSLRSNVSFSDNVRRETTTKFDNFMKECRAAYLSVLPSTSEKITSTEELMQALQFGGRNPSRKVMEKYWKTNTDNITYNDFCDIMRKERPTSKETLLKAFKKIDVNGDGFITFDELFKMLTTKGERMTKSEVQSILDEADYNHDGKLDYNEFCNMIMSTSESCVQKSMDKFGLSEQEKKSSSSSSLSRKGSKSENRIASSPLSKENSPRKEQNTDIEEPRNLKSWSNSQSKGSFFVEQGGGISSHHYTLVIPKDTQLWLTIQSMPSKSATTDLRLVDMCVFIVEKNSGELVTFTESRLGQKYCVQCQLNRGKYQLLTFTTGCRLLPRKYEPTKQAKLVQGTGEDMKLTSTFRNALTEVFTRSDLDGDGYLSRTEFDLFQSRTSGEPCDDEAWEVMRENFEMNEAEQITLSGFLELNLMEAKDADGDPDDLWVTMESMGYNKSLELDQACSFYLDVFVRNCEPKLTVTGVGGDSEDLEKALMTSVMRSSATHRENVKGMRDLILYRYDSNVRTTIMIENQSYTDVKVRVDCGKSKNCVSHRDELDYVIDIKSGKRQVVHHIVPSDPKKDWNVRYAVTIEK